MSMYKVGYIDNEGVVRNKDGRFIIRLDPWDIFGSHGIILLYDDYHHLIGDINHGNVTLDRYGVIAKLDDFRGKLYDLKGKLIATIYNYDFTIESQEDLLSWYKSLVPISR